MDVELLEIRDFLAAHPPFDHLPAEVLERLPRQMAVRYLRRGTPFPPSDATGNDLYVVRKGALELRDGNDQLVGKFGEGELYSARCSGADPTGDFTATTVEDSLFYLLPCQCLDRLRRDHEEFNEHFSLSVRTRLRRALDGLREGRAGNGGLMRVQVAELLRREPVHVTPQTSLRDAARLMTERRVSALLIMEHGVLQGILTDRDLRARCVADGLSTDEPVTAVMTRKLHKVQGSALGFEALITMTRLGIHHLPVLEGKRVAGVISSSDLVRHQSANAVYLVSEVRKCETVQALREASAQLPELQVQLVAADATAYHLGQAISTVTDALTQRLIQLAEAQLGPAPVSYAWLSCGSQARHEQTVHSDQDNALLLADDYNAEQHGTYFEQLAQQVNDGLNACGFMRCPGEVMASNPKWRQPFAVWRRYFDTWITRPEPMSVMLANNFFDMRVVHGEERLYDRLHAEVLQQTRENRIFLAYMAANALRNRPPLGFFRHFVLIRDGEHDNTLNLKHRGIIPITDLVRVYALSAGLPEVNTLDRLRSAADAGAVSRDGAANLEDALEFIATLRARHQAGQIKHGAPVDNYVPPEELSALERNHLKDAFAVINTLQDALGQRHQSGRFA